MHVADMFVFFVVVALAAIGVLEWLKALLKDVKVPGWLWTVVSAVICLVAGVGAVLGGMFSAFFSVPTVLLGVLSGLVVGLVALAFVETCYQQVYKLLAVVVAWVVDKLTPKAP
jgi:hypothetical protein